MLLSGVVRREWRHWREGGEESSSSKSVVVVVVVVVVVQAVCVQPAGLLSNAEPLVRISGSA